MIFNQDMFMDVQLLTDLESICGRKQQLIDENAMQINKKQIDHHYCVGDMVKLQVMDPTKLEERFKGPYRIQQVNANGTVLLQTRPGVTTPINIRKIEPYRGQL